MISGKTICTITLCLLCSGITSFAQLTKYVEVHEHQFEIKDHRVDYSGHVMQDNELKQIVSGLFIFYKNFISSQDQNTCVFSPSCSVYAMQSIKQKGVFIGGMNAFDRLTRCHAMVKDEYPIDPNTSKYYDPVH